MLGRLPHVTRASRKVMQGHSSCKSTMYGHIAKVCSHARHMLPLQGIQRMTCRHIGGMGGPVIVPDRDRIHLSGLVFHGYHGVLPEVRRAPKPA